jgi:hypothetical protein
MSTLAIIAVAGIVGVVLLSLIEKAPAIVSAIADVRMAGDRSLDGLVPADEVNAAALLVAKVAIRRTDPDLNAELVDRMALTVVEDVADGMLNGELDRGERE